MSRTLWFAAGAGATVYAMNRARRLRESFTVDGLRDRASSLAVGVRMFRDEVAQGRHDKETELRERLGLVPDGTPALGAGPSAATEPPSLTHHERSGTNQEGTN
ncbi:MULTISPECIES: DUF6167 family protein [unclassified Nocardioides]|uniref:DUF6167 family protein n=1 Tax=unclassified Nocardioides TaxID=2615069 RepID=UPI0006F92699|nr:MULTISPECIES: DUF6167 family protein [unclassified Nocardioides]KQY64231.1 hypothetical protein ASD30_04585 [Nocardioides sp. Root140]KQZ70151.1 hypothetical protein ASD66_10845 [Nocardioides sp. Root151]